MAYLACSLPFLLAAARALAALDSFITMTLLPPAMPFIHRNSSFVPHRNTFLRFSAHAAPRFLQRPSVTRRFCWLDSSVLRAHYTLPAAVHRHLLLLRMAVWVLTNPFRRVYSTPSPPVLRTYHYSVLLHYAPLSITYTCLCHSVVLADGQT